MLLHLCTEAVRQRSPTVEVADSLSGFMREMGFAVTGGERGTIRQFKEQLHRLAACTMQIGLWDGQSRSSTITIRRSASSTSGARAARTASPGRRRCSSTQDFYDNLVQHALPVDIRRRPGLLGLGAQARPAVLDRLPPAQPPAPLRLNWDTVHRQFGADNALAPQLPPGVQGRRRPRQGGLPEAADQPRRGRPPADADRSRLPPGAAQARPPQGRGGQGRGGVRGGRGLPGSPPSGRGTFGRLHRPIRPMGRRLSTGPG